MDTSIKKSLMGCVAFIAGIASVRASERPTPLRDVGREVLYGGMPAHLLVERVNNETSDFMTYMGKEQEMISILKRTFGVSGPFSEGAVDDTTMVLCPLGKIATALNELALNLDVLKERYVSLKDLADVFVEETQLRETEGFSDTAYGKLTSLQTKMNGLFQMVKSLKNPS